MNYDTLKDLKKNDVLINHRKKKFIFQYFTGGERGRFGNIILMKEQGGCLVSFCTEWVQDNLEKVSKQNKGESNE